MLIKLNNVNIFDHYVDCINISCTGVVNGILLIFHEAVPV
jgi:hypothetical protein